MSKIQLDPNGVQVGYKVLHFDLSTLKYAYPNYIRQRRVGNFISNAAFFGEKNLFTPQTIAIFKLKYLK
jgi:hypothetical protein